MLHIQAEGPHQCRVYFAANYMDSGSVMDPILVIMENLELTPDTSPSVLLPC